MIPRLTTMGSCALDGEHTNNMTYLEKVSRAKQLIKESYKKYPDIILGCSFGKDSMTTLHLVLDVVGHQIPVFAIMANTEFQETYDFANKIAKDWNLNYREYRFDQEDGGAEKCCGKPKVEKTKEAVKDVSAWISGVRSTEGITRADFKEIEERGGLVKINPIVDFTELDIWRYLALNNIPINPKYKEGYRSLGCALCSSPEEIESESERAGRWKGTSKECGECGIHVANLRI